MQPRRISSVESSKMKPPARNYIVVGSGIILNMVMLGLTVRTHTSDAIRTPCVVPSQSQYAWEDNRFSMATSGKIFRMHVQRQFANASSLWRYKADRANVPTISTLDCKLWAVVTTISSPTATIRQLQALASTNMLCLVIVGDRKTPDNYTMGANAVYLSPEQQDNLPYRTIRHLPWNHFGRKNVGFLYAIHHGAQQIYDTDDDNELSLGSLPTAGQNKFDTIAPAHALANLCPCFGSKYASTNNYEFSWPRGFPLESIKDPRTITCTTRNSTKQEFESVAVVQSLADNDPDVDAIYRLTRPLPVHFESEGNNIIIPEGTFMPYNAQATMHARRAMWGLLLPITVHGRVSDIWRSYLTQRIMWSAGLRLAMARPWVVQKRNAHNYLGDLQAEQNLYYQAGALVAYLHAFDSSARSIPELIEAMYISMYEHGVLEIDDVYLAQAWLSDLRSINYTFPAMVEWAGSRSGSSTPHLTGSLGNPDRSVFSVFDQPLV